MKNLVYISIQTVAVLLLAPLLNGVIRKIKAFVQKRHGAPLFQTYFDIFKLLKKTAVISDQTTWVFRAAPYIVFSTALAGALLVPLTVLAAPAWLPGDFLVLVYLLALGRFFTMLAGLDPASAFGGMGSSREALISALIEPTILVSLFTVGRIAGTTSLQGIMNAFAASASPLPYAMLVTVFPAMLIAAIAETSRIPVDDPATHLELTMVHEAMTLEYSGRHLALMELGASLRQLIFVTLLINLFVPTDGLAGMLGLTGAAAAAVALLIFALKAITAASLIAVVEAATVKLRFFSLPNLAALSFILALLGFAQHFVFGS